MRQSFFSNDISKRDANEDADGISLLDEFDDNESQLEDPFARGPESVVRDVLQDELVLRSLSKISAAFSKRDSLPDTSAWIWMETLAKEHEDNEANDEPESKDVEEQKHEAEDFKDASGENLPAQGFETAQEAGNTLQRPATQQDGLVRESLNNSSLYECEMSAMSSLDDQALPASVAA